MGLRDSIKKEADGSDHSFVSRLFLIKDLV